MTSTVSPVTCVQRRVRALRAPLTAALEGDAAALHRARVASRRLRELLPLIQRAEGGLRKVRKRVRRLTRLLGRVREMDVSLELLERSSEGVSRLAVFEARRHLNAGREAHRAHMLGKLHKLGLKKIDRSLDELVEVARGVDAAAVRRALATRLTRRATSLRRSVAAAGAIYVPERLHAVRLGSKKLRYALELAAELGVRDAAKLAATVRRTQVTLGTLQDHHVLLREIAEADNTGAPDAVSDTRQGLLTLGARLEQAGRELHAHFLAQRETLKTAIDAVRQQVVPELLRARHVPARAVLKRKAAPRIRKAG
jgi:CHAD domain-containing protein